jgi:hypothetical protein
VKWIFGDLSFLNPSFNKTDHKDLEDKWGREIFKRERPDLKLDKQWTNLFGEYVCREVFLLLNKKVSIPEKKENQKPDLELEDAIIEVKTGTYHTRGTVHEKILGTPFKYSNIPRLYQKPLKIVCIGGAEKKCREYEIIGDNIPEEKKEFIQFYKKRNIEYIPITQLLLSLL